MVTMIRPIKGFKGYHVGSDGKVWTQWRTGARPDGGRGLVSFLVTAMRERKTSANKKNGYHKVTLRKEGKYYTFLVHRLVLEAFAGPCPEGMEARHLDGDKNNNRLSNMLWGTREENVQDSIRHGKFYNATKAAAKVNRGRRRVFTEEHKANMSRAAKNRYR